MIKIQIPPITHPIFSATLPVGITHINYGQHLGHDALVSLLHEARVRCLLKANYSELNIEGKGMLVTQLGVTYINEAFYGDQLLIKIGVHSHTQLRLQLIYQVHNQTKQQETARAFTTIAFYDPVLSKVCAIPSGFLSFISCQT